jgi:hypothetical protein
MSRQRWIALLVPCALLASSCSRADSDRKPSALPAAPAQESRSATPAPPAPGPTSGPRLELAGLSGDRVRPAAERVIAIGDLHGDLDATRRALKLAGAIDDGERWIGDKLVVVQTGDTIDRGDEDRAVLDLLHRVRDQAKKAGGELILLNGNHELMNVAADFRYVTPVSNAAFSDQGGRMSAFRPAGPYARMLATQPMFVKVGSSVFVHGGILARHLAYGLDRMDDEVRAWMRGELPSAPEPVASSDGVVWARNYSLTPGSAECAELHEVLAKLDAKRMVVGHTVQQQGINAACNEQVIRIDVGLSKFYGGPMQVLELRGDTIEVRREPARPAAPAPTLPAQPQ